MKLNHPLITKTAGLIATSFIRRWMGTLDSRWVLYEPEVDPALSCERPRLYLFWHEYVLLPLDRAGHADLTMLLSRHRDAEVLSRVAQHLGFGVVRGSTFDGASSALRDLIRISRRGHLTMTPDGPRGPRRVMAPGPIYLASKLGLPIVPMGFGYDRPWRLKSWDRFAVPRPYSRVRGIMGPEIRLPRRLDRDGLEHYRLQVERMVTRLSDEAEAWAEAGTPKIGERPFSRVMYRREAQATETSEIAPHGAAWTRRLSGSRYEPARSVA
jgi:lysophospholipid acyltransferase (LPLAT)-like uncharacterized protein